MSQAETSIPSGRAEYSAYLNVACYVKSRRPSVIMEVAGANSLADIESKADLLRASLGDGAEIQLRHNLIETLPSDYVPSEDVSIPTPFFIQDLPPMENVQITAVKVIRPTTLV